MWVHCLCFGSALLCLHGAASRIRALGNSNALVIADRLHGLPNAWLNWAPATDIGGPRPMPGVRPRVWRRRAAYCVLGGRSRRPAVGSRAPGKSNGCVAGIWPSPPVRNLFKSFSPMVQGHTGPYLWAASRSSLLHNQLVRARSLRVVARLKEPLACAGVRSRCPRSFRFAEKLLPFFDAEVPL